MRIAPQHSAGARSGPEWATVRKHLPAVDVAAAGGWAGPHTLQTIYQRPDKDTMYEVVTGGGQVREANWS